LKKKISYIIASFFGAGYCPVASGTAGSLATLPFAFLFTYYCGGLPAMLAFFALVYIAGTLASKEVLKYTSHDPSLIVIDEVAGQLIPLIFFSAMELPSAGDWWLYIALPSFILFRIFDISKPFPASYFDKKMLNAHGVMLDDIAAGVYALAAIVILPLLFSALVSCSSNSFYSESGPRITIEVLPSSDTVILTGSYIYFQAQIYPPSAGKKYYWEIDSTRNFSLGSGKTFGAVGSYNARFYVTDFLDDTLSKGLSIQVSGLPICDNLGLTVFQGSPIFDWNCYSPDSSSIVYNFILRDEEKTLLDTTLQKDTLQLGKPLPDDYWEVHITATNHYGFKTVFDSIWSLP
jgi:phosphatidylglycerophosphatase A